MPIRIGINGFGRVGRLIFRAMIRRPEFEVVAINDLADPEVLAHLFRYDTVFGRFEGSVKVEGNTMLVDGKSSRVYKEKDPRKLPWRELEIDFVIESTGVFTTRADCTMHLEAGARKVLLTAPAKDKVDATIVMGVNHETLKPEHRVISNASCTTNCLAPIAKVINDNFGIVRGFMTTIHAFTNDQRVVDQIHRDLRRARTASLNIIPTTTGAAKAIGLVIPELSGKMDGIAMRVPIACGSIVDLVVQLDKTASTTDVNLAMKDASEGQLKGILEYTEDPIVSSDIIGNEHSAIFDAKSTMLLGDNFVKVLAWYDNEWAYAVRCLDVIECAARLG
jgi:glyceraldehyde 3-phosphate dehydrogenase